MRNVVFLLAALVMLIVPARAEQTRPLKLDQPVHTRQLPVKQPKPDESCAAYGAGFVKLADTGTCVQIGGSVSIGVGRSVGGR